MATYLFQLVAKTIFQIFVLQVSLSFHFFLFYFISILNEIEIYIFLIRFYFYSSNIYMIKSLLKPLPKAFFLVLVLVNKLATI